MIKTKHSKQRDLIYSAINEHRCHPTAEYIYDILKKDNPKLSLGTVYRNLQYLSERGAIVRLSFKDQPDHFDADLGHHYHGVCESCGTITDIPIEYQFDIDKLIEDRSECKVLGHELIFRTLCKKCQ